MLVSVTVSCPAATLSERHEHAERDQLAEGEVHDAREAEDERVSDRHQAVDGTRGEPAREDLEAYRRPRDSRRLSGDAPSSRIGRGVARPGARRDPHRSAGGLVLDRAAIDADLQRRQAGYGRSPRQQIEQDRVEVLAGLRHGRTLGTPLALVVRNVDHKNWTWGMAPWPPDGEPEGKGTKPVTLPRPGHADLAGAPLARPRRCP